MKVSKTIGKIPSFDLQYTVLKYTHNLLIFRLKLSAILSSIEELSESSLVQKWTLSVIRYKIAFHLRCCWIHNLIAQDRSLLPRNTLKLRCLLNLSIRRRRVFSISSAKVPLLLPTARTSRMNSNPKIWKQAHYLNQNTIRKFTTQIALYLAGKPRSYRSLWLN